MPLDSSWKIAVVSPLCKSSNVFWSFNDKLSIFNLSSLVLNFELILFTDWSITVSVLSPKKSNFTKPADSTSPISN